VNNEIKQVPDEVKIKSDRLFSQDINEKEQRKSHQQKLFWSVLLLSLIGIVFSIYTASTLLHTDPSNQKVAIIGLMITAPIILILALLRYVYDGKKTDDPQPTLMLNIGKEFASVLTTIFKK